MSPAVPEPAGRATAITELLDAAPQLAARFAERAPEHDRAGSFPFENFDDLRANGWPALVVPEAFGGMGGRLPDALAALERLAAGDGSTALAFAMHLQTLGAAAETQAWPAEVFADVCRDVVGRGALLNACASEPELGSPSRGGLPRTVARRVEGAGGGGGGGGSVDPDPGWSITGRKNFASMAPALDYFIVPAAIAGEEGMIGRFLVPATAGVQVIPNWDPMGMRATGSHDIALEDVVVPAPNLLYRQSAAAPDPYRPAVNAWFTLCLTVVYLGIAGAAVTAAAGYALTRVPTSLGRPIATLEGVQRDLGEAELALRASRALLYGTAEAWDRHSERRGMLGGDVVAAKLFVTQAAVRVVDLAMRAVGGASMRRDLPLERHLRDARAGLFHPPSVDEGLRLLGRLALEREAPGAGDA